MAIALLVLRVYFHGPRLAHTVEGILNQDIRGRVEIASIEWPLGGIATVVSGGWIPITIRGLQVYDDGGLRGEQVADSQRKLILQADLAEAYIDAHSLIFGHHDVVIRNIVIPQGGYVIIEEVAEPYPIHPYGTTVVSLASAFYGRPKAGFRAGSSAESAPIFDLRSFHITGATLELIYPSTHLTAEKVSVSGFVRSDASDPLKPKLYYALSGSAQAGLLRVGDIKAGSTSPAPTHDEPPTILEFPLMDIAIRRVAQLPHAWPRDPIAHDVEWDLTANTLGNAQVTLTGALRNYWVGYLGGDLDIDLHVTHAGPLISRLSEGLAGGDDLSLHVRMSGPNLGPKFTVHVEQLALSLPLGPSPQEQDAPGASTAGVAAASRPAHAAQQARPPLDLHLEKATATFDLVTEEGTLEDTVARGAGGEVRVAATFGLAPFSFDAHLDITKPITVGPYLPPEAVELAGSKLYGELHVFGDGVRQQVDKLELWLGRVRLTGALMRDGERSVHVRDLEATRDATRVSVPSGSVDVLDGTVDLAVLVRSTELDTWLTRFEAPPLARTLDAAARVTGPIADPTVRAELGVGGIPLVGQLAAKLGYASGMLALEELVGSPLGGRVAARGKVRLGPRPRVKSFWAKVERLDLGAVPLVTGLLDGHLSARATASGRVDRLDSQLDVTVDGLSLAGESYRVPEGIRVRTHEDGSKELSFAITRMSGGSVTAHATVSGADQLGGRVDLDALPAQQLAALGGLESLPVGGMLNAALRLSGTPGAPTAEGQVSWFDSWFEDAFLGPGGLTVRPLAPDRIAVEGSLLQGDIRVSAIVQTQPPYEAEVTLFMRRVELDRFAPELATLYGVRAWVSGEIRARTTLLADPKQPRPPLAVSFRLTEAEVWIANEDADGRPAPIRMHNKASTPIAVDFDGATATLVSEVILVGPNDAELTIAGSGSLEELDVQLSGTLEMVALEPYLRDYFDAISGRLGVDVQLSGPIAKPDIVLGLRIAEMISVRPRGQDALVSLAQDGLITVTNEQITPTALRLLVNDPYTGEEAGLDIKGGVTLDSFVPTRLGLIIEGELSGKMLLVALPEVFSRASGVAKLELTVAGTPDKPRLDGELAFASTQPLSLTPRGLRRELRFTAGTIVIADTGESNVEIVLDRVAGTVDDEGKITSLSGAIDIHDWQPVAVDLTLSADSLPFRIPEIMDLNLAVTRLHVVGDLDESMGKTAGLDVTGAVEIIDGRYIRNFNLITDTLRPADAGDGSEPFYESMPILANALLDIDINVRGFYVQNNIANIQLIGNLDVTGTPREPRLGGEIKVEQGVFKLPGVRARFTRTHGSVSFSEFLRFPSETPVLDVQSESDYRDPGGQEHLVTLKLKGPISNLDWDLYTSSGLNKGQTLTMIVSGRKPEELRKQLGDEAPGRDPGRQDPSTNPSENVADELIRDLASDAISLLVEDKLRNLTTLDVARLEIGTGSIGFHGEKEFFKNLRFLGDLEQTLNGRTFNVRGVYRLSDQVSVEGEYLSKDYEEDSEEDISDFSLRMVWRRFVP